MLHPWEWFFPQKTDNLLNDRFLIKGHRADVAVGILPSDPHAIHFDILENVPVHVFTGDEDLAKKRLHLQRLKEAQRRDVIKAMVPPI